MNYGTLFVVLILFIACCSSQQCSNVYCGEGLYTACNSDLYNRAAFKGSVVPDDSTVVCPSNFYCGVNPNFVNGESDPDFVAREICLPLGLIGDSCLTRTISCSFGLSCLQVDNGPATCQALYYATFGESCQSTYQCARSLQCDYEKKVCVPEFDISPYPYECQIDVHCPFGAYCNGTYCIQKQAFGGNCTQNSECVQNAQCVESKCIEMFTQTEGQACSPISSNSFTNFQGTCANLYCNTNSNNNTCFQFPTPSPNNGSCTVDGCNDAIGEQCFCTNQNSGDGKCYNQNFPRDIVGCGTNAKAFQTCAVKNKCNVGLDSYYYAPGSCVEKYCKSEICKMYESCSVNNPETECFIAGQSYGTLGFCGGNLSSDSTSIHPIKSLLSVLVMITILILY